MILLDTYAWVWLLDDPTRLPGDTLDRIETEDLVAVSTISCWEIAMLCAKGRVGLSRLLDAWIEQIRQAPRYEFIPLSLEAAKLVGGTQIDWPHGDPSDRMIVATAIDLDIPLVTADRQI
ncbi:MAG: type II toxin-antitoxin system VapC family toxin [Planctomycetota bacterium]